MWRHYIRKNMFLLSLDWYFVRHFKWMCLVTKSRAAQPSFVPVSTLLLSEHRRVVYLRAPDRIEGSESIFRTNQSPSKQGSLSSVWSMYISSKNNPLSPKWLNLTGRLWFSSIIDNITNVNMRGFVFPYYDQGLLSYCVFLFWWLWSQI